ncbi:MAG: phosphate ABC transporter permease subunit PstC [Nitriliruptor sp.]|uniref:phosphate ABC transporter permease subunit PstC n=1 Tax=Nitriliruptor sp. TaxID=2448056 RepID=UPI00349FF825
MSASTSEVAGGLGGRGDISLRASSPRYGERLIKALLGACAAISVVTTVAIVLSIFPPTIAFFRDNVGLGEFLTGTTWSPLFANGEFGVLPLVTATLVITVIALAVAIPIGLLAAIYLSEYAPARARKWLKPLLEVLAGIPTVVYGFFALEFVGPDLLQRFWPGDFLGGEPGTFSALAAGLVMGFMIVPTIASLSEDALRSVPMALRQGSSGLGASKLQTTLKVVLPAAISGIVAAMVLGVSRAIGETMIVLIAAGGTARLTLNPTEGMQTMTSFIGQAGIGDLSTGSVGYQTIFAVGALLFLATLVMNLFSIRLVRRFREVYE